MSRNKRRQQKKEVRKRTQRAQRGAVSTRWSPWRRYTRTQRPDLEWPPGAVASWHNDHYVVVVYEHRTELGTLRQLMIQRKNGEAEVPWVDKQRIKDQVVGMAATAVEMFPPHQNKIDSCNCYWLWIWPDDLPCPFDLAAVHAEST